MIGNYVYFFYSYNDTLLYIGKTTNIKNRMKQHFSIESLEINLWKTDINKSKIIIYNCNNITDLDIYETYFINKYNPKYNIDKVFNKQTSFELPYLEPIIYSYTLELIPRFCFKDVLKEYCELLENDPTNFRIKEIELLDPNIKEYVNTLGISTIRTLKYVRKSIQLAMYDCSDEIVSKLSANLLNKIEYNKFYSSEEIKQILKEEFQLLNINKTPKANLITTIIPMEYKAKKINKKVIKGYILL